VAEAKCDLCAGQCRGHNLANAEEWVPEPGSRAHAAQNTPSDLVGEIARDDLVKRMASRICDWSDEDPTEDWWSYQKEYFDAYQILRAALLPNGVSVREECAKVADDAAEEHGKARAYAFALDDREIAWQQNEAMISAQTIAAAIRAMPLSTLEGHDAGAQQTACVEAIALIDEINERSTSRAFNGINQPLHAKLCTIRATLARAHLLAQEQSL
jgi:hypothetical protein